MWTIVFRKSAKSDVTIFEDEVMAGYFAKVKKAPSEKYPDKDKVLNRTRQLGYSYFIEYRDEYISPALETKQTASSKKKQTKKKEKSSSTKKKRRNPGDYQKYLASPEWRKKRNQRIILDDNQCQICGSKINLEVHHLTYDRVFNEDVDDLITLYGKCHRMVHGKSEQPSVNLGS